MPTSIAITTIISEEDSEYSIQRAGLIPRVRLRSYQLCSRGEASAACAIAEMSRNAATSGPIRTRKSTFGTATSLSATLSMRRNELVTGNENELARARIASPWMRWSAESPVFHRRSPRSLSPAVGSGSVSAVIVCTGRPTGVGGAAAAAPPTRSGWSARNQHLVDDVDHAV